MSSWFPEDDPDVRRSTLYSAAAAKNELVQQQKAALAAAVRQAYKEIAKGVLTGLRIELREWVGRLGGSLNELHDEVITQGLNELARRAQLAMLESYEKLIVDREGPASATHYRAGEGRLADGVLAAALGREDFYSVTGTTLQWGNKALLNSAAAHWKRLAAGAGARGEGIQDRVPVKFQDTVLATIGLNIPRSKGFYMPRGVWESAGGAPVKGFTGHSVDIFEPRTKALVIPTEGIRGRDYFLAGLEVLAGGIGTILQDYMHRLKQEWVDAAQMQRTIKVNAVVGRVSSQGRPGTLEPPQ